MQKNLARESYVRSFVKSQPDIQILIYMWMTDTSGGNFDRPEFVNE